MNRLRAALRVLAALALAWMAGFVWFVTRLEPPASAPAHADGIVVLTGGADRVGEGLRLLKDGHARALLISGVGRGVELPALERDAGIDASGEAAQIELGRAATSTAGNAEETADWVRRGQIRSLLVVTAAYHMPRALTELQRALPGVLLIPVPVLPPALRQNGFSAGTLRLLAHEYTKFLAATLGLSRLSGDTAESPQKIALSKPALFRPPSGRPTRIKAAILPAAPAGSEPPDTAKLPRTAPSGGQPPAATPPVPTSPPAPPAPPPAAAPRKSAIHALAVGAAPILPLRSA